MDIDDAAAAAFAEEHTEQHTEHDTHTKPQPLAIVIAAYNEAGGIAAVVRHVPQTVCGLGTEVIVVDDGSGDDTAAVAAGAGALVCHVPQNRGQGAALRLGYRLARERGARFIATLDGDGQYDPAELERVVAPLVADRADFVTGSRRLGTAHTTDSIRAAGVVVFGALISVLTGTRITDPANGLRAMRTEVPASITLRERQYQASELLIGAILAGWRVQEVPTTMHRRTAGETKKGRNLMYGARFAKVIVATWWRDRSRHRSRGPANITNS